MLLGYYEGWIMLKSMISLMIMSIIGGSMLSWMIFPTSLVIILPLNLKLLTLLFCILGGLLGYLISKVSLFFNNKAFYYYKTSNFLGLMWFMPYFMTYGIISYPLLMGKLMVKLFDQGWSEFFGGQQLYLNLKIFSSMNQVLQNNNLKIYLLSFVIWVMILWFYMQVY